MDFGIIMKIYQSLVSANLGLAFSAADEKPSI
jgi:hypothetical protein